MALVKVSLVAVGAYSMTFRRDYSYTVNKTSGAVNGTFDVKSNSEVELVGYGNISNVDLTQNITTNSWSNFNFSISVTGGFQGTNETNHQRTEQSVL